PVQARGGGRVAAGARAQPTRMTVSAAREVPRARSGERASSGIRRRKRYVVSQHISPTASDRIMRRLGLSMGLGGVIMGLVTMPEIIEQGRAAPGWWSPVAALLTFGGFPVLAGASVRSRPAVVRAVSGVTALSFLVALAITPIAVRSHTLDTSSVWL